jgi:quercetin dioxygenase-like cupin family protein
VTGARRGEAESLTPSAFGTWNGREAWNIFPTVSIHAVGGDQVLIARVEYEPGTTVQRHSHEATEQVMWILEGALEMTVGDETRTLGPGDTVVVNRGVEHELRSEGGVAFLEALAPVPLDHVPDAERDLVLGDLQGSLHVER